LNTHTSSITSSSKSNPHRNGLAFHQCHIHTTTRTDDQLSLKPERSAYKGGICCKDLDPSSTQPHRQDLIKNNGERGVRVLALQGYNAASDVCRKWYGHLSSFQISIDPNLKQLVSPNVMLDVTAAYSLM
jgi:hypothetical protein